MVGVVEGSEERRGGGQLVEAWPKRSFVRLGGPQVD